MYVGFSNQNFYDKIENHLQAHIARARCKLYPRQAQNIFGGFF